MMIITSNKTEDENEKKECINLKKVGHNLYRSNLDKSPFVILMSPTCPGISSLFDWGKHLAVSNGSAYYFCFEYDNERSRWGSTGF